MYQYLLLLLSTTTQLLSRLRQEFLTRLQSQRPRLRRLQKWTELLWKTFATGVSRLSSNTRRAASWSYRLLSPKFDWLWDQVLSPAYLKTLDVLGPKVLIGLGVVFVVPEVGDVVPSVSDWLNLAFEIAAAWRDNYIAATESLKLLDNE